MITIYTILVFFALGLQSFFTISEMAITSVNRIKLKDLVEAGDPHAEKLKRFIEKKGAFLGTTLVGTNISVVIASVLVTRIFSEYFTGNTAAFLTTLVLVPVTLIFAEIIPKIIARQFSTSIALKTVTPLEAFQRFLNPVIVSVNAVANFILSPFGKVKHPWDVTFTKSDLKKIILSGREIGAVEEDEADLIHKILDLGGKTAGNTMIPLYRVSSIGADETAENLKKLVALRGFSRIPVYRDNKDDIIGIINIYDMLFSFEEDKKEVDDFIREPVYIRMKDGLDIALTRLRYKRQPMGIVVDENEKPVGIITIEDILEEIVGEIEDLG